VDPATSRPSALPATAVAVLLAAAAVAFSLKVVGQGYWCDDAFISFRYARNLFQGHGLVFNPGDRVEGYTNFLWVILAWAGLERGLEPMRLAQWVGLGAAGLTVLLAFASALRVSGSPARALLAPLFLAGNVGFLAYPMTGMETSLQVFLVVLATYLVLVRVDRSWVGSAFLGLVFVLLGLNRFDGFVPVLILLGWCLLVERRVRPLVPALVVTLAGFAAFHAWRYSYYGQLLPNTVLAKAELSPARVFLGARDLIGYLAREVPVAAAFAVVALTLRRLDRGVGLVAWTVLGLAGYGVVAGGDWMPHFRFFLPATPLLYVLLQEGLGRLTPWTGPTERLLPGGRRVPASPDKVWSTGAAWAGDAPWATGEDSPEDAAQAMAAEEGDHGDDAPAAGRPRLQLLACAVGLFALNLLPRVEGRRFGELTSAHMDPHEARFIGEHLEDVVPADRRVAIEWGGIVPYYAPHRVLDTFGLTDPAIVASDRRRTMYGVRFDAGSLAARQPDLVIFCARLFPTEEAARAAVAPGGSCHYGFYLDLEGARFGYRLRVFALGPQAYWPALERITGEPGP